MHTVYFIFYFFYILFLQSWSFMREDIQEVLKHLQTVFKFFCNHGADFLLYESFRNKPCSFKYDEIT